MTESIYLDCDPGLDDFLAVLAALTLEECQVVGLSSVAGNLPITRTTENLGKILDLKGRQDLPYVRGSEGPLLRDAVTAEEIHGETGLGSIVLPAPTTPPAQEDVTDFLLRCAQAHPGALTVVAVGPLTNIARALLAHPQLKTLLKQIVFMGGAHAGGNVTPKAEFNAYADPHAAQIVLTSGIPVTMVGLDATMARGLSQEECRALKLHGPSAPYVLQALEDMISTYVRLGLGQMAYAHDLTALLCALHPEAFQLVDARIDVELQGPLTFGQTVCDFTGVSHRPKNAKVAMGVTADYLPLLTRTLEAL